MANIDVHYDCCLADISFPGNETILQAEIWQNIYKIPFIEYYRFYFISDITAVLFSFFCFSTLIQ